MWHFKLADGAKTGEMKCCARLRGVRAANTKLAEKIRSTRTTHHRRTQQRISFGRAHLRFSADFICACVYACVGRIFYGDHEYFRLR